LPNGNGIPPKRNGSEAIPITGKTTMAIKHKILCARDFTIPSLLVWDITKRIIIIYKNVK